MTVVATLLTIVLSVVVGFPIPATPGPLQRLPAGIAALEPLPDDPANPSSPAKIELGRRLFFDPLLSGDGTASCSSCHLPEKGFADGERTSMGYDGYPLTRHTPTVVNAVYNEAQNWDGKFTSIADHAMGAMTNPRVMNMEDEAVLVARLETDSRYDTAFLEVFGEGPTKRRVAEALEVYMRTLTTTNSRFDQWARGNRRALSDSEKRGLTLFVGKASCARCHRGPTLTDDDFHALGVTNGDDPGRFKITKIEADRAAFKTPALRNVALTAPYMHDGSLDTLREVVDFYNHGGGYEPKSPILRELHLTEQESQDLVAFLEALTGNIGTSG